MKVVFVGQAKSLIVTHEPRIFRKPRERSFLATRRIMGNYCNWVELPDHKLVPDRLSFQLDEWLAHPPAQTTGGGK